MAATRALDKLSQLRTSQLPLDILEGHAARGGDRDRGDRVLDIVPADEQRLEPTHRLVAVAVLVEHVERGAAALADLDVGRPPRHAIKT